MIKCNVKRDGIVMVKVNGTAKDITSETAYIISEIHHNIQKQSPEAATAYRNTLAAFLLDPKSPLYEETEASHE